MSLNPSSLRKHFTGGDSSASANTTSPLPRDDVGPHIIHDGCDKVSSGIDIVFVHGLRGSRIQTWSSGNCFWPRDFLSKDLEHARLITWGYDADIANAFKFASRDSIYSHADTLLNDLARVRQTDITRPIIFVCHSLGGLVVKDALIKAASHDSHKRDRDLALIYQHTKAVLFLGTPHRGSHKEAFGDLLARAANLSLHQPNTQLLQSLRTDSHILEKQRDDFITISKNLLVRCVKEERPTPLGIIVPKYSAYYDGFTVRAGSIDADHINMVKFKSAGDQGYQRILGWINSMRNEISTTTANTTLSVNEDGEEDQGRGLSRLHMAAAAPSTAYLKQVLRESPRGTLNAADGPPHHRTPLHMAIFNNLPENIAILLEAGADVKKPAFLKNEWWPPLFLAAVLGNAEAVEALISVGRLDPDQPFSDTNGNTALHVAAVNRKPNVARTLLRLGADPWSKDEKNGWDNGWTALDCAFNNKDEEMIDILQQAIEQRAQRYQEVFEPSQSSVDRSDVYDDGRRSPQGSVIAPETYSTNFMPFQGSTGFSSVDDAPPKTLSSATGLGTHGIPESESSNIERACSDDQHVSDTMSIHTDGREHNLDLGTKLSLTGAFASHIVENLTPQQLDNLFDQPDAIAPIAELIGDFSVLLGMSIADDDIRSRAVTFVRHQRVDIAKGLASAAKAWIPSTTDQVSMEEKLKMLHFGDTEPAQYDDPNLERDCPGSPHDEGQLDSLYTGDETPELRDVVLGKNFVLGSEEFPWMIDCIRRYESLTQTGKIFSSVRSGIARTIESHSEHIEFSLDWDIAKMLDQQYYGESRSQICLSDMIVYNGTSSLCYASTTSEYVRQIWPALGVAVVRCFDSDICTVIAASDESSAPHSLP